MQKLSKENNFDLIRLVAALQVLFWHSFEHLHFDSAFLNNIIHFTRFFPGVPVFFAISGFLIYASYDRNKSIRQYFKNRMLRIFPGLWCVTLFTLAILIVAGFVNRSNMFSIQFLCWFFGQITVFQFYTPQMLRGFGVGTPNGSLWTILVEFSFYVFLPVFFFLYKILHRKFQQLSNGRLIMLFAVLSLAFNLWFGHKYNGGVGQTSLIIKFIGLSLPSYLFYFLIGSYIYVKWDSIKSMYIGKGLWWLLIYLVYCLIFSVWLHKFDPSYWPNIWGLMSIILLSQTTIAMAYTKVDLSNRLLKHNDVSYGIYLFHMPVINVLVACDFQGKSISLLWAVLSTVVLAYLSWIFIEKPALSLKDKRIFRLKKKNILPS